MPNLHEILISEVMPNSTTTHPFLSDNFPIQWATLVPEAIEADIGKAIANARNTIEAIGALRDSPAELTYENTFGALESGLETLHRAWGLVNHLDSVCNSPELRSAQNLMLPKVSAFLAGIPLDDALWQTLRSFGESPCIEALTSVKKRHIQETLADFREQGASLNPAEKKRVSAIQLELAELTQKYAENCLDATNTWEKIITDEALLAGLPQSALAAARQSAIEKGLTGSWRFTLQAPSFIAVMTYADNEALRREVWQAYTAIGRGEPYDNREIVPQILALRHEFAQIVGYQNFADSVTARRMAGSGQAALDFTTGLQQKLVHTFHRETEQLLAYKAGADGAESHPQSLEPWETAYYSEKQRRTEYDFDEEALRPYFPINRVIEGMFGIAQELFGLTIEEQSDVETWHPEVTYYNVLDTTSGEQLGAFYADWHPRESKRGGAWMNYLITGRRESPHRTPHLGLICGNLSPSVGDQPALLTHREVETIFHEFGHLLHHLCGEVEVKSLNGVNVAWDFVELPSQIMENWCWERDSLNRFARHYKTGDIIPDPLFEKMLAARNYRKASTNIRQLAFTKMDLDLHIDWPKEPKEAELESFIREKLRGYSPQYKTEPPSNVFNFSHLFSDPTGYAAGYYSYKWAEVLDADAFTRFREEGILNPATGADFRKKILARGNAQDPAILFHDFMGRPPDTTALLRRDGLL